MLRPRLTHVLTVAAFVLAAQLIGCSSTKIADSLPDQRLVYKKQREAGENLEIPPDLAAGSYDDALDIPDAAGAPTTFSEYSGGREHRQQVAKRGDVLPEMQNVELKRRGNDRWLEVQRRPRRCGPRSSRSGASKVSCWWSRIRRSA